MSEVTEVTWLKIPIVGLPEMSCQVPTDDEGRALDDEGEPLPIEQRTHLCAAEGRWMLGSVFLCQRHAAETAGLLGDDIGDIEAAWRAQL